MQLNLGHRRRRPAFTLIEILVVALLIAILSAIGLISVRSFMERNRLRVVVGETYQIATALSFARDDIGFYPKLNFLLVGLNELGTDLGPVSATNPINPDFEYFGNDISALTPRIVPSQRGTTGAQGWQGPYMGMSEARRGLGGPTVVTMELPISGVRVRYPADAYFQPYTLYQMSWDELNRPNFINGPEQLGQIADLFTAVVSYGPNQVPGGENPPSESGLVGATEEDTRDNQIAARLYTTVDARAFIYRALEPIDYEVVGRNFAYYAIVAPDSDDLIKQF